RKPPETAAATHDDVRALLAEVGRIVGRMGGLAWEGAALAVAMPPIARTVVAGGGDDHSGDVAHMTADEWEDLAREAGGWEFIDFEGRGRNDYGGACREVAVFSPLFFFSSLFSLSLASFIIIID